MFPKRIPYALFVGIKFPFLNSFHFVSSVPPLRVCNARLPSFAPLWDSPTIFATSLLAPPLSLLKKDIAGPVFAEWELLSVSVNVAVSPVIFALPDNVVSPVTPSVPATAILVSSFALVIASLATF